jgi:hypothetical protein
MAGGAQVALRTSGPTAVTAVAEAGAFAERLRAGMQEFRRVEAQLRTQYAVAEGAAPESMPLDMLELPTRRFLIDHFLRLLTGTPMTLVRSLRKLGAQRGNDRLYLDYLGVSPMARAPVLIVEAKGFDVSRPRRARGRELDAKDMTRLICDAVFALKDTSQQKSGIIAEWSEYLADLKKLCECPGRTWKKNSLPGCHHSRQLDYCL